MHRNSHKRWTRPRGLHKTAAVGSTTRTAEVWNNKDQLTSSTVGGTATSFTYTGSSQKLRLTAGNTSYRNTATGINAQTISGTTTVFVREPSGTLNSLRTGTVSSGSSFYYLLDNVGSVTGLVNASGGKVNGYGYDPYGQTRTSTESVANPWRFTSGILDSSTNLYKFGGRYYDSVLGRYNQLDPSGKDAHYSYAGNGPVSAVDPSGKACFRISFGFVNAGTCSSGNNGEDGYFNVGPGIGAGITFSDEEKAPDDAGASCDFAFGAGQSLSFLPKFGDNATLGGLAASCGASVPLGKFIPDLF